MDGLIRTIEVHKSERQEWPKNGKCASMMFLLRAFALRPWSPFRVAHENNLTVLLQLQPALFGLEEVTRLCVFMGLLLAEILLLQLIRFFLFVGDRFVCF